MKTLPRLLIGVVLSAATVLSAQTDSPRGGRRGPGGPGGPGRGGPAMGIVRVLDTDQNREISAAEIAAASASILTLDTNKDGVVSADELRPTPPNRPADAPTPPAGRPERLRPANPVMLALDANSDGALSSAEIANAPASLAALDANKDGKLTPDELRPLPPKE